MSLANGNSTTTTMTTAMIERISRLRSSIRCDMNDCCVSGVSLIGLRDRQRHAWFYTGDRASLQADRAVATTRVIRTSDLVESRQRRLARRVGVGSCRRRACSAGSGRRRSRRGLLVQLPLDIAKARLHVAGRGRDGMLEFARGTLHFALQLAHLVELPFTVDVRLDVIDVALQAPEQVAERTRGLRQTFRADHDERHDADDDDFREADVEHGCEGLPRTLARARRAGRYTLVDGSLRTSPSIVRPVTCDGGSAGGGTSASAVFMPSLKPFTAPPRS